MRHARRAVYTCERSERKYLCTVFSVDYQPTESDEGPRDALRQMKFRQLLKTPVLWPVGVVVRAANF